MVSIPAALLQPFLQAMVRLQRPPDEAAYRQLQALCRLRPSGDEAGRLGVVRAVRDALRRDGAVVRVEDHGAGVGGRAGARKPAARTVASIHATSAVAPAWGLFLFRLVRVLRPSRVLELGTNLGVSGSYLQAALELNGEGRLVTIEGDPALAARARALLGRPGGAPVEVVTGRFQDVLPALLPRSGPFDLVFIDGHHEEEATVRYYDALAPHLTPHACVVFDDLEPGPKRVRRAWRRILAGTPAAVSLDLLQFGLLFPGGLPAVSPPTGAGRTRR